MGSLSIFHVLILLAILVAGFGIPIVRILNRLGYSGFWAVLMFVPMGAIIGLWVLAFADWPALPRKPG